MVNRSSNNRIFKATTDLNKFLSKYVLQLQLLSYYICQAASVKQHTLLFYLGPSLFPKIACGFFIPSLFQTTTK